MAFTQHQDICLLLSPHTDQLLSISAVLALYVQHSDSVVAELLEPSMLSRACQQTGAKG